MRKMVMAVVPQDQANAVMEALIAAGYTSTFTESRGGMLRQAQQMLFIAVREEDLDRILDIVRENCRTQVHMASEEKDASEAQEARVTTTHVGSAVVFVWDLERFETY